MIQNNEELEKFKRKVFRYFETDVSLAQLIYYEDPAIELVFKFIGEFNYDTKDFKKCGCIEAQKAMLLMKSLRYEEALEICEKDKFINSYFVQKQHIEILFDLNRYEEALEICEREKIKDSFGIQKMKITALIALDRLSEVLEICEKEEFKNDEKLNKYKLQIKSIINERMCDDAEIKQKKLSKRISYLIRTCKLEKALKLCEGATDLAIISQKVTILMKLNRLNEALEICSKEEYYSRIQIQSQKISILMMQNKLDSALKICEKDEFKTEEAIQSQRITILIKLDRLDEALEICNKKEFELSLSINSQKISILLQQGKCSEAMSICDRYEFLENEAIQLQKLSFLIKKGQYDNAIEVCNRECFKNNYKFQSIKINVLIKKGMYEEALEICRRDDFINIQGIQSQGITALIKLNRLSEALDICNYKCFSNDVLIQSQKITVLLKLDRKEDALEICDKKEFSNDRFIESQRKKILMDAQFEEANESIDLKEVIDNRKQNEIFTRIYLGNISLSEIESSDIDSFEKIVLKALYYEKNKILGFSKIIKKYIKEHELSEEELKILKHICSRLERKNTFLDYDLYSNYLGCMLISGIIEEETKEKQVVKKVHAPIIEKEVPKKEKEKPKYIESKGLKSSVSKVEQQVTKPKVEPQVIKPKKSKSVDISKIKIEDIYPSEVMDIKKYLYVNITSSTAQAWDNFCALVEKSITDTHALSKFMIIAKQVQKQGRFASIDVDNLEEKIKKYVKPNS